MKKYLLAIVAGLCAVCCQNTLAVVYTNLTDGATLDVSSDLNIINSVTGGGSATFAGIQYTNNVSITGAGNISVENNASASEPGLEYIYGIENPSNSGLLTNSGYTGNITVENDRSLAPNSADNSAETYGVRYGRWVGDVDGDVTVTAIAGTATNGNAQAKAYGMYSAIDGSLKGTLTVSATGGTATNGNASTIVKAIQGDLNGDLSGAIVVTADCGTATGTSGSAYANVVDAYGVTGDVKGDLLGTVTVNATGGSTTATNGSVSAYMENAYGVGGTVSNLSGSVTVTAAGGTASSTGGRADAGIDYVHGVSDHIYGDLSGSITVTATGGVATASGGAYGREANAYVDSAKGVEGTVWGNLSGTVDVAVGGGTATVTNGPADVYVRAWGVDGNVTGDVSGTNRVTAIGGTATIVGSGDANAKATAYGVKGDIDNGLSGLVEVTAKGGVATGATASSLTMAYGVFGQVDGIVSGTIIATATAGLSNGDSDYAEAYGINVDGGGDLTLSNATVSAQAYEYDGTAMANRSYALYNVDALSFMGGVNRITGQTWADSVDIADGTTVDFDGRIGISGDLTVGEGATMGLCIGEGGLPKIVRVGGTAAFSNSTVVILKDAAGALESTVEGQELLNSAVLIGDTNITYINQTSFEYTILAASNTLRFAGVSAKSQDATAPAQVLASASAANAAMNNISRHSGLTRGRVRGYGRLQGDGNGGEVRQPEGSSGPDILSGEWSAYFRQFNDLGGLDSGGTKDGFDWQTSGYMLGMERLIQDQLIVGFAGGQSFTDLDGKRGSGGGASKMIMGTVYGSVFDDVKYLEAGVLYAQADNDSQRINTVGDRYMGSYDSALYGGWLEVGYALQQTDDSRLESYIRSSYVSGNHDGFTDTGGPIPMTVAANGTDNWIIEGGARLSKTAALRNGGFLRGEVKAGLQAELLDNTVSVNTVVAGSNQRPVGPDADRAALVLGLRLDWELNDQLTVGANYEPTLSSNWQNHSLDFSLKYQF